MPTIILRELHDNDWAALQACLADDETVRYTEFEPLTEASARRLLEWAVGKRHEEPRAVYVYGISLTPDGELIGIATLTLRNAALREADIGFIVKREQWGQGYGTAAVRSLLQFGFETLKLHRIYGECAPDNPGSARVMGKAGMVREGLLREYRWQKGRWVDRVLYAVLDREWPID